MSENTPSDTSRHPTLRDIANELGVTTMTVSKSLRGIGRISDEMRRMARLKAEEIGTSPPPSAYPPPLSKYQEKWDQKVSGSNPDG